MAYQSTSQGTINHQPSNINPQPSTLNHDRRHLLQQDRMAQYSLYTTMYITLYRIPSVDHSVFSLFLPVMGHPPQQCNTMACAARGGQGPFHLLYRFQCPGVFKPLRSCFNNKIYDTCAITRKLSEPKTWPVKSCWHLYPVTPARLPAQKRHQQALLTHTRTLLAIKQTITISCHSDRDVKSHARPL